jgi:hypothetical protein
MMVITATLTNTSSTTGGGGVVITFVGDNTFTSIGPAAVPALVWGVNFIAANKLGDC